MNDMPKKIQGDEYVLHMDAETARIVSYACELYSRLRCGQFQELRHLTVWPLGPGDETFCDRLNACEEGLNHARNAAFPEFAGSTGRSYGVGHYRDADAAWNTYQAIRYVQAWHENPEGGVTVDFREPIRFSDAPMPRCEVRNGDLDWHECFVDPKSGELVDTEETENVTNMPELFRIEAHRSEQTGIPYISFISWIGPTPDGEWTDIEMTDDDIHKLLNVVKKGKVLCDD